MRYCGGKEQPLPWVNFERDPCSHQEIEQERKAVLEQVRREGEGGAVSFGQAQEEAVKLEERPGRKVILGATWKEKAAEQIKFGGRLKQAYRERNDRGRRTGNLQIAVSLAKLLNTVGGCKI